MTKDSAPGNQAYSNIAARAANERTDRPTFLQQFEGRLARLPFLCDAGKPAKILPAGGVKLSADKFTATVLWFSNSRQAELLLGWDIESAYVHDDHVEIRSEHGVHSGWRDGFLMTVGERRFLSLPEMASLRESKRELLRDAMRRYKIEAVFAERPSTETQSVELKDADFEGDKGNVLWLGEQDHRQFVDGVVLDNWAPQYAELYGLTNYELMRLRLMGEVPWGIKPNPVFQKKLKHNK